jgi:hypothetical protein
MKKLRTKDWMVILGFVAIAIGALYVAEFLPDGMTKSVFREVASLVGITGILGVILRRRDYDEILDIALGTASLSKNVKDTGLFCVFPSFRDINFRDEINQSLEAVDICVIYSSSWIKSNLTGLLEFTKHKNAKIRICFVDPNCLATSSLNEKFKMVEEGNLAEKIQESINFVRKNFSALSDAKIEIYIQPYTPQHSMYRFDNKVFIIPYFLSPGRFEVPVFGFKSLETGTSLYKNFLEDFERLLQYAVRVPLK